MKAQKLRGREEILSARIASILVFAILLFLAPLAQAVPITIEITGEVTSAIGSALPGSIYEGVTFTGSYTYDSSIVDSGGGHYVHDAPYGISLSLGGYEFKTDPSHIGQFDMRIADDLLSNGVKDFYSVRSYENISIPSLGLTVGTIRWDLSDSTHTALSSGDLPITAPVLVDWDYNYFKIYGFGDLGLSIEGTVTQAVPEPLAGLLMVVGVLFFRRRRKTVKAQKLRGREKILSARITPIFVLATLLLSCPLAQAVPVTIEITGEVTSLGGYTEAIPDTIYEGVTFTGSYTYDSSTIDSGGGHYVHDAPYGISIVLGGYEFKTVLSHVGQFDMWIMDDHLSNGVKDYYLVRSYENTSDPSVDFIINSIEWNLWDSTHTALSSGDLPATVPALTDWDHNVLNIFGLYGPNHGGVSIYGTVTQAVPEPMTVVLMAIGVFFLRRRR